MARVLSTQCDGDLVTLTWDDEPTDRERAQVVYRHRRATAPERALNLGVDVRLPAPAPLNVKNLTPD